MNADIVDDPFFVQGVESYHRGDFLEDCPFDNENQVKLWRKGWHEGNKSGMFRHHNFDLVKNLSFTRFDFDYDG